MTKKEYAAYYAWLKYQGTGFESPLYKAYAAVMKRNYTQRVYRASDDQKAKEALASRKSYWKKRAPKIDHGSPVESCPACRAEERAVRG